MKTCGRENCQMNSCDEKISDEATIVNERGLHARAAAMFVKEVSKFKAEIVVEKGGQEVCGRSIMGLMMLAASKGCKIKILSSGEQAEDALKALTKLVKKGFYEAG